MNAWKPYKLGEIITLKRGYDLPERIRKKGKYPVVSSSGISDYHNKYKVKAPCVATGRYGTLGKIHFVNENCWALNTTLYVKDFRGNDPKFVYYFLQTLNLEEFNGAAAVPGLDRNVLHKIKCVFPKNIAIQKNIASILSAYDNLIEVNNQRIKILEETASQLYKEWFVRMRFPGYKQTKFEKGIPEGWEIKKISELSYVNKNTISSKTKISEIEYIDISSVSTGKIETTTSYFLKDAPGRAKRILKDGDTIFSTVRPENRAYAFVILPSENTIASTGFCVITPMKEEMQEYIYLTITTDTFIDEMSIKAKGSAYPQVGFEDVAKYKLLIPEADLIKRFHEFSKPLFRQIKVLLEQNGNLRQIRDRLLPRLISGKLQIKIQTKTQQAPVPQT